MTELERRFFVSIQTLPKKEETMKCKSSFFVLYYYR